MVITRKAIEKRFCFFFLIPGPRHIRKARKLGFTNVIMRGQQQVAVATRSFPRDGGIAEDHGAPEAGQLLKAWTRDRRETESRQRASGAESPQLDSEE